MVLTRAAEASAAHVDRLSTLPDDLLGRIFSSLRDVQDDPDGYSDDGIDVEQSCQALLQTCKAILGAPSILAQITTLNLYLDAAVHGSMATQLLHGVPPGSGVRRIKIRASSNAEAFWRERGWVQREDLRTIDPTALSHAFTQHATHCTPLCGVQLQNITDLALKESCRIGDPDQEDKSIVPFMDCFVEALPNMVSLQARANFSVFEDFLTTQAPLKLTSLEIRPVLYDDDQLNIITKNDCAAIGKISTLTNLTLYNLESIEDIIPLSQLSNLHTLGLQFLPEGYPDLSPLSCLKCLTSLKTYLSDDKWDIFGWDEPPGLDNVLRGCCLQKLSISGLVSRPLQSPTLKCLKIKGELYQVENKAWIPCLRALPALESMFVPKLEVSASLADLSSMFASFSEVAGTISLCMRHLTLKCTEPVLGLSSLLLQSLAPDYVMTSLETLEVECLQFESQQLTRLSSHFPNIIQLMTTGCSFSAPSMLEVVRGFECLERLQLKAAYLDDPEGFVAACLEAAQNENETPLTIDITGGNQHGMMERALDALRHPSIKHRRRVILAGPQPSCFFNCDSGCSDSLESCLESE